MLKARQVKGQRLQSQAALTFEMNVEVLLDLYSLHYIVLPNLCEKVGQNFDSVMAVWFVSLLLTPFEVKPHISHDKSFVMTTLYTLKPAP